MERKWKVDERAGVEQANSCFKLLGIIFPQEKESEKRRSTVSRLKQRAGISWERSDMVQ